MQLTTSTLLKTSSGQMLGCLSGILKKGAAHASAHKIPEEVLLNSRLYPDMFPTTRQVQIACDQVTRGTARLAGVELPVFQDVETSFAELIERAKKANAFCQASDDAWQKALAFFARSISSAKDVSTS